MDPLTQTKFLPRPWLRVDDRTVVTDQPIRAGRDPLVCQFLSRTGTDRVYIRGSVKRASGQTLWLGHWHQLVIDPAPQTLSSPVPRAS